MFAKSSKSRMPNAGEALPGRTQPLEVPATHYVTGGALAPADASLAQAMFGMGCFWGAEKMFWQTPGVVSTNVGYAGGFTPNATYEEVCSGGTGHTEVVRVFFDPAKVSYDGSCGSSRKGDPTQGASGKRLRDPYRSAALLRRGTASRDRRIACGVSGMPARRGPRRNHDRGAAGAGVLLCRELSPAVSRQESGRLLRARRHGHLLPDRPRDEPRGVVDEAQGRRSLPSASSHSHRRGGGPFRLVRPRRRIA